MEAMASDLGIERLYDEHAQALFAYLMQFTRDEGDTRDLLQEVFVKLARQPGLLGGVQDERAFLVRLAHNAAVDLMRRRGVRHQYQKQFSDERVSLFAEAADGDEATFRAELGAALAAVPAEQREVLHLKLWEGMTFEAIGAALGIPSNTAASRYRYGLDKLRDLLRPLYDEIK
jgi:RNA polymerase sigma-70 factor, ECF subfamily